MLPVKDDGFLKGTLWRPYKVYTHTKHSLKQERQLSRDTDGLELEHLYKIRCDQGVKYVIILHEGMQSIADYYRVVSMEFIVNSNRIC